MKDRRCRDVDVVESAKMVAAYFPNVFSFVSLFCAMCEDEDRSPFIYAELTTDADGASGKFRRKYDLAQSV